MSKRANVLLIAIFLLISACFALDSNIYGGELVEEEGKYPFVVQLLDTSNTERKNFCGGSMIGPLHVLSAAHCLKDTELENLKVGAGALDITSDEYEKNQAESIYSHNSFASTNFRNDIAIVKLEEPFSNSAGVRSIEIAQNKPAIGKKLTIAGYGITDNDNYPDKMRYVSNSVISLSACKAADSFYEGVRDSQQLCTFTEGKGGCSGDGGSPLFYGSGSTATLFGIVSGGAECGTLPTINARSNYYRDWIKAHTAYDVCYDCTDCEENLPKAYKEMCLQVGGEVFFFGSDNQFTYCCTGLNVFNIRKIDMTWNGCDKELEKDLCKKIGRFSCSGTTASCKRF
jgi:secreted trypsin-like serine protease